MDQQIRKTSCQQCSVHIEYPAIGFGESIACPSCGERTKLGWDEPLKSITNEKVSRPGRRGKTANGCMGCLGTLGAFIGVFLGLPILGTLLFYLVKAIFGLNSEPGYTGTGAGGGYYNKEIRDGVKAYDPGYQLTPSDERMIRNVANELNKQ